MSQHSFCFKVRMAMQVAMAVAEEVENNTCFGREFGLRGEEETRPVLLGYDAPQSKNEVVFRFEGGIVVRIYMFDTDKLNESWRSPHTENWVVYQADIRYYAHNPESCIRLSSHKVVETWDDELEQLKEIRSWWHPDVVRREDIQGDIGIFYNRAENSGFILVNPESNQEGHSTLVGRIPYSILVEGDEDRAVEVAREHLKELLERVK